MPFILLGCLGFVLFFAFDINQVFIKKISLSFLFLFGSIFILIATVGILFNESSFLLPIFLRVISIIMTIIFLAFMIYSLFFAIPFKKTYCKANNFKLCKKGVYALCRHPAVPCFMLFYLFLWFSTGIYLVFFAFILFSSLNILYSLFQDYFIFPRIFDGYLDYKKSTPFIIPSIKTIKSFITDLQK
jgi:protein-S-isoprenylcysteine O-methyltransferase Ste14